MLLVGWVGWFGLLVGLVGCLVGWVVDLFVWLIGLICLFEAGLGPRANDVTKHSVVIFLNIFIM